MQCKLASGAGMSLNEKFITGRLRKRLLRSPVIDGWLCDEEDQLAPERSSLTLDKLPDDAMGIRIPSRQDYAKLTPEAAAWINDGGELEVTVGWPEQLVILRRDGVVVYAEGDPVHFGALPLDAEHSLRRSGYEYLDASTTEVKIELELDCNDEVQTTLLGPAESAKFGPYSVFHERSFDPSDRQSSLRHHGYFVRIRRDANAPIPQPPNLDLLHPLDIESPGKLVELARRYRQLVDDEAMYSEPAEFKEQLKLYEGAGTALEEAVRGVGPSPPTFRRRGETLQVVTASVSRGQRGETLIGRATILLHPTRVMTVSRLQLQSLPGRMRRPHSSA